MGQENLNYLKDRLLNHEVYVDSEKLWKEISTKRRKAFYLRLAFLTLLLFAIISYYGIAYMNSGMDNAYLESSLASITDSNLPQKQQSQDLIIVESSTDKIKTYTEHPENITDLSDANSLVNIQASVKSDYSSSQTSSDNIRLSLMRTNVIDKNFDSANNNYLSDVGENSTSNPQLEFNSSIENGRIKPLNNIEYLACLDHSNSILSGNSVRNSGQPKIHGIECFDHSGKKMDLYLLGYTALDFLSPSMTVLDEFKDYLEDRMSSQKQLLGYRAGVQLKYLAENGLYIKGGLNYGEAREKFEYRKTTETDTVLPNQLIEINIDINGDTTLVYGNAPVKIIEMKNWKVGNKYKSFGAHLLAGYQMHKGQFVYGFETGVQYNISFKFSGMLLNDKLEPVMATDYFESSSKFSILGGINAGYQMNELWTLYGSLDYIGNLGNINSTANLVNQKNNHIGLSIGLQLKI